MVIPDTDTVTDTVPDTMVDTTDTVPVTTVTLMALMADTTKLIRDTVFFSINQKIWRGHINY
jgi:hypothetical protein